MGVEVRIGVSIRVRFRVSIGVSIREGLVLG